MKKKRDISSIWYWYIININKMLTQLWSTIHYLSLSHNEHVVLSIVISVLQKWKPKFMEVKKFVQVCILILTSCYDHPTTWPFFLDSLFECSISSSSFFKKGAWKVNYWAFHAWKNFILPYMWWVIYLGIEFQVGNCSSEFCFLPSILPLRELQGCSDFWFGLCDLLFSLLW